MNRDEAGRLLLGHPTRNALKGRISGVAGGSTTWEGLPTLARTIIGKRPADKSPAPPDVAATRIKLRREHTGVGAPLVPSSESRFINLLRDIRCSF